MAEDRPILAEGGGSLKAKPMFVTGGELRTWCNEMKLQVARILGACRCKDRTLVRQATERALRLLDRMPGSEVGND